MTSSTDSDSALRQVGSFAGRVPLMACTLVHVMRSWLLCTTLVACAASTPPTPANPAPHVSRPIAVGDRAPEVAAGNVTVVAFWATWSAPGKHACYRLEEIWQARKAKGLAIKSVSVDDEATYLDEFKKSNGMTYPVEWDRDHRLAQLYQPRSEPTVYVVDRAGIVRFIHPGWHDEEASQVAAEVDSLL